MEAGPGIGELNRIVLRKTVTAVTFSKWRFGWALPALLLGATAVSPVACHGTPGTGGPPPAPEGSPPDASDVGEPDAHPVVEVTMNANDLGGSGANTEETFLNIENVNVDQFGRLFTLPVDGDQFAQPLYMGGLKMGDGKTHNVVFVSTENDTVFAFDADTPGDPLWKTSVGTAVPIPNEWFAVVMAPQAACEGQTFNMREVGITGTPVIDPTTQTLYVVALHEDTTKMVAGQTCVNIDPTQSSYCTVYDCTEPTFEFRLHALDLVTGAERTGSPVIVSATVDGTGWVSQGGKIAFDARQNLQRVSLLLDYGTLYFTMASYADIGFYHGWVFAYDAATLTQKAVLNTTPNGEQGGIWMSGRHMLSDHNGSVYLVTGNGTFDPNMNGGVDYGDSVLRLDEATLAVSDWFSPFLSDYDGQNFLEKFDDDLGSAGATLIPNTTLLLASGKTGKGYVVDTANLGHLDPNGDKIVQEIRMTWPYDRTGCAEPPGNSLVYSTPTVWQGPDGTHVYVWGSSDYLRDYLLDGNGLFTSKGICFCEAGYQIAESTGDYTINVADPPCGVVQTQSPDYVFGGLTGGTMSVSSNGKEKGTGIVWATRPVTGDATHHTLPGYMEAFDATYLTKPLWTSQMNAARDNFGNWAKFTPPTIANGKVYVPTQSNQLVVYGLLASK
jgi:hypothetical protein